MAVRSGAYQSSLFYQRGMGFEWSAVGELMINLVAWTLVLGIPALVAWRQREPGFLRVVVTAVLCLVWLIVLLRVRPPIWLGMMRPLPLVAAAALASGAYRVFRRDPQAAPRAILAVSLAAFALLLLAKMPLNARIYNYGFVLAMPAVLLLVVVLLDAVPAWIAARGGSAVTFRAAVLVVVGVGVAAHLAIVDAYFSRRTEVVGKGDDAFLAGERSLVIQQTLASIARESRKDQTLLVLPEGQMLNYLARRVDPSPYGELMPTEVAFYGEDRLLASFAAHPPDFVALVDKDTSEYGARYFGRDYAQQLALWVRGHYHEISLAGGRPFEGGRFGILLLRRNDLADGLSGT
jgi:hypothetical protein